MKGLFKRLSILTASLAMVFGVNLVNNEKKNAKAVSNTVTYTVATTTSVTSTGIAPEGASATFKNTYTTKDQITSGKSQTLTLSGYQNNKITGIVLSMHSNAKKGAGTFSAVAGTTTIASISSATNFNQWFDNTSFGTSYRDVTAKLTNANYTIQSGEDVVITITATTNSLYCQSFKITYEEVAVQEVTADDVIALINEIGNVEYTDECKAKIDAARASYESLDESTKALVTNYQTLLNAEAKYEELKQAAIVVADKKAAADVDALINAIGEVTDYSKKEQIKAARKAYESLTETQKGYVTALETLTNAETELDKYKPLQYEIDTGKDKAEGSSDGLSTAAQLEEAWATPDGISWVSGSKAYGSATETLKLGSSSASGYVQLQLDSNDYYVTNVIVSAKAYGSDAATLYVNDLDKVSLTTTAAEYTFDISSSKTQDIKIGTGAKRAYIYGITVQYAKKDIIIDQNKVNAVIELINSIGTVEASLTSMKAIEKAEAAYEELLTAEKELVTNYTTLTTARTTFDSLVKIATTVSGIGTGYTSYDFTIGELKMNTNIGGNSNCVGFNSSNKSKATLDSTIASAIEGASTTTTGMIALHAEFYNGFISLDLKATDTVAGNAYVLSSNNGGKTYTLVNTTAIDTGTNGIEFKIEANLVDITDFVIVIDASSSSAARLTVNSITYYDNLVYSEDLTILLDELSKLDSCTNYDDAASVRELLNGLSERDQVLFSRAEIEDLDSNGNIVKVNAEAKLSYMEAYAAHMAKNSSGSNIMSNLANSNSVSFVLIIGIIGLGSILGYYFINKKRMLSK